MESRVDEIVLPNHITEIRHNAFNWCEHLWYVIVPDGVTLENVVFNQCHALKQMSRRTPVVAGNRYETQSKATELL